MVLMTRIPVTGFLALALTLPLPALAETLPPAAAAAPAAAPLADLVKAVTIPYERFTLSNGLTVLVHTDRKAPVIGVSVWYGVGSKHEPRGKTGFAHLFEHLMFNGSEHAPGDFFEPLQQIGATDYNGTTWFDRTNYFETVPTGALDRILMLESDRMGFLLPAMTQEKLDNQRGVVKNEKRGNDNQPYGLVDYEQYENLYPSGHPYHHDTIGSMADLDSASLEDVRGWFRDHYGPNNAILVLAGDIDVTTARAKVTRWFGDIPAGPKVVPVTAPVPTLSAPLTKTILDQVATTRIYRMWAVPGLDNPDYLPLQVAGVVLGGLASSRLDDALVRGSQLAVGVTASVDAFAQAAQFIASADVKPGADADKVGLALDAEIARLIKDGPSADELARAATVIATGQIRQLESVGGGGGKASTLAEGLLFSGDPEHYREELARVAALTPDMVRAAMAKWLLRPAFTLIVKPGTRTQGGEARGGYRAGGGGAHPAYWRDPALPSTPTANPRLTRPAPTTNDATMTAAGAPDRSKAPPIADMQPLEFPKIERATLSNGMKVFFARRDAVPIVSVRVAFDAGFAADPKAALGTTALLLRLMNEGTETLDSSALARARERLGANINGFATADWTAFQLDAVTPNLAPSLDLLADYVRHPALAPAELERVRAQQLASIAAEMNDPGSVATRVLYPVIYGPAHPYGIPPSGTGDAAVVKTLTRAQLMAQHHRWLRPDTANVFVVGDTTLAALVPLLEASFGDWKAPAEPAPVKDFAKPVPAPSARILLVDRPGAPQSMITAAEVLNAKGTEDLITLRTANEVIGGFLGRINLNLRETKGWAYSTGSGVNERIDRLLIRVIAPVQTDKTGPAITEIRKELAGFLGTDGVRPDELAWSTQSSARELPGMFETSGAVLEGIAKIVNFKRADDYFVGLPARYKAMTAADIDKAARAAIDPAKLVWVVVGDAAKVRPQLDALGLPVEVVKAAE